MAKRRGRVMSKGNEYRKLFSIDRFARYMYCQHARLNQLRSDKRDAKRKLRRQVKDEIRKERGGEYD